MTLREKAIKLCNEGKFDTLLFLLSAFPEGQMIMAEILQDEELHEPYVDWSINCAHKLAQNPVALAIIMSQMKENAPQHWPFYHLLTKGAIVGKIPTDRLRRVILASYGQADLDRFEFQNPGPLDGETVPVRDFLKAALQSKMLIMEGLGRA